MMKALLFLISVVAFGQGTDLPGPIGALPNSAGTPTKVCSYGDATLSHCSGFSSGTNSFTWNLQILDAGYTFDNTVIAHSVNPSANLTYTLGDCASSATCPSGSGAKEWLALHVQAIYNYGANPMSIYSDTTQLSFDTHAAQPIQFYTTNTDRFDILGNGNLEIYGGNLLFSSNNVTNIGSSANQAADMYSVAFTAVSGSNFCQYNFTNIYCSVGGVNEYVLASNGTLLLNSLVGTGTRLVCTDSTGTLTVSGCSGGSGVTSVTATDPFTSSGGATPNIACPSCSEYVTTNCTQVVLTVTYANITSCVLTLPRAGAWLLIASQELIVDYQSQGASIQLTQNGSVVSSFQDPVIALANGTTGENIAATVGTNFIGNAFNSGDVLRLQAAKSVNSGGAYAGPGTFSAIFLHP